MPIYKNFLVKYWILIFATILVGILHVSPHLYLAWKLYPNYTPLTVDQRLNFPAYETTYAYASEVNQILQGNLLVGDGLSFEYSGLPSPFSGESLPAILVALISKLFNSIDLGFIVSSAVFPALAFLLIYFIFREFKLEIFESIVGSIIVIIFRDFLIYFPYPTAIIGFFQNFTSLGYLPLNRSFSPQVTFVILCLAIYTFIRLLNKPTIWRATLCGVVIGGLYYTYLFHWTATICAMGVFFVFSKLNKKYGAIILIVSLFIGLPYFVNMYLFRQFPLANDFNIKSTFPAFQFYFPTLKYALIAIGLVFFGFWRQEKKRVILLLIAVSLILPTISQIVLGRDIEGDHWITRIVLPTELLAIWVILTEKLRILKKPLILVLILAVTILLSFWRQFVTTQITQSAFIVDIQEKNVFDFLNKNTKKDSVVATLSFSENILLSVYTHNRLYLPRTERSLTPVSESIDRLLLLASLYKISPKSLDQLFGLGVEKLSRSDDTGVAHIYAMSLTNNNRTIFLDDKTHSALLEKYAQFQSFNLNLKKYRVDYLLVGPVEKKLSTINIDEFGYKKIYNSQKFSVYIIDE